MIKSKQETIEDIVADMRELAADIETGNAVVGQTVWRNYADRIEVAWKRESEATTEKSSRVGNAAAMREALETISKCDTSKEEDCYTLYRVCEAALSALPRNCDIGTVAEQSDRMRRFCCDCGGCAICKRGKGMSFRECVLAWAQMPYEEGSAK